MKISEYQADCERTANREEDKKTRIMNWLISLGEESGEVAGSMKKALFHGHDFDDFATIKEIGDVLYYVTILSSELGYSLEEVMTINMMKRRERYPDGFSEDKSRERVEYK
jgi:NTP pyrophosphatase (non-canonical NTP hydrolase)